MAKKSKLLTALDAHKGKDYKLERQKILQKKAERKKKLNTLQKREDAESREDAIDIESSRPAPEADNGSWESDQNEEAAPVAVGS